MNVARTDFFPGRPGMNWMSARVFPAVNLTEDAENYYIRAELPPNIHFFIPGNLMFIHDVFLSDGFGVAQYLICISLLHIIH